MALSQYERETIINYNDAESEANIYTASPSVKKKLEKLGKVTECNGGWELNVPKNWVTIRPPKKAVKLTEEQKVKRTKQLAEARKKRSI